MSAANKSKYDQVAMSLHWVIAALMIFMIFFGEDLMKSGERGAASTGTFLPSIHVSVGTTILLLSVFRLLWRLRNPPPPLPTTLKPWEVYLSHATHVIFYVLLIGLPVTGWMAFAQLIAKEPAMSGVTIFGVFHVPGAPIIGFMRGIHALGSNAAMAMLFLHVLAALKHQFIDRDGIFRRMLPL